MSASRLPIGATVFRIAALGLILFGAAACGEKNDEDPTPAAPATISAATEVVASPTAAVSLAAGSPIAGAAGCWTDAQRIEDLAGKPQWSAAPAMVVDPAKTYTATMETTMGTITIELLAKDAPVSVNSFVCLARSGFFDGIQFHRVVNGFVIQAGDPTGSGSRGPGYQFQDELPTALNYERGTLAMANAGPNTNGSQFFICLDDLSQRLQKNYSIFGKVTAGMEAVDAIAAVPVQPGPSGEPSSPTEQVLINRVTISET